MWQVKKKLIDGAPMIVLVFSSYYVYVLRMSIKRVHHGYTKLNPTLDFDVILFIRPVHLVHRLLPLETGVGR